MPRDITAEVTQLVRERGPEVLEQPARFRALISDRLGADVAASRREVGALIAAIEEGLPSELRSGADPAQVAEQLQQARGLTPEVARSAAMLLSKALNEAGYEPVESGSSPTTDLLPNITTETLAETAAAAAVGGTTPSIDAVPALGGDDDNTVMRFAPSNTAEEAVEPDDDMATADETIDPTVATADAGWISLGQAISSTSDDTVALATVPRSQVPRNSDLQTVAPLPEAPRRRVTPLLIGAAAAVLVLLFGVIAFAATTGDDSEGTREATDTSVPSTATAAPSTTETAVPTTRTPTSTTTSIPATSLPETTVPLVDALETTTTPVPLTIGAGPATTNASPVTTRMPVRTTAPPTTAPPTTAPPTTAPPTTAPPTTAPPTTAPPTTAPPRIGVTVTGPQELCMNASGTWRASALGSPTSIAWSGGGSGTSMSRAFPSAGSYNVTATASYADGRSASDSIGVVVYEC